MAGDMPQGTFNDAIGWRPYQQTIILPVSQIAIDEEREVLALIQQKMDHAERRMTCYAYHEKISLYGWRICVACGEWFAPPSDDEEDEW